MHSLFLKIFLLTIVLGASSCILPPPRPVFDARNLKAHKKEIKYIYSFNTYNFSYINENNINEKSNYPLRQNYLIDIGVTDRLQLGGSIGPAQLIANGQYQIYLDTNSHTYIAYSAQIGGGGYGFNFRKPGQSLNNLTTSITLTKELLQVHKYKFSVSSGLGYEYNYFMEDFISVGEYDNYEVESFPVTYEQTIDFTNFVLPLAIIIDNDVFGFYGSVEYLFGIDFKIYKEILTSKDDSGYSTQEFISKDAEISNDFMFNFALFYRL